MGYLLMLAAMTYNTGIFFAVVLGMTFGFYCLRDDAAGPESQGAGRSYDMANFRPARGDEDNFFAFLGWVGMGWDGLAAGARRASQRKRSGGFYFYDSYP